MDAAELAGLKVLSLMNENTAVAMKYAIDLEASAALASGIYLLV